MKNEKCDMENGSGISTTMRALKPALQFAAAAVGAYLTWKHRYAVNPDGVSYLDVADAWLRGDWKQAINGVWSPLYSWILASAMFAAKPAMQWEYPVAHLVNLGVFLCALASFGYLLDRLIEYRRQAPDESSLPDWVLVVSAYVLFIWAHTVLIPVDLLTPDTLLAALVYFICGLLVRIRLGQDSLAAFASLGLLLGLGYLAKAIMFLAAFGYLAVALLLVRKQRPLLPRALLVVSCFLLLAAPFIAALSAAKGRVAFSDAGRLNYAWFVNRVKLRHWQGEGSGVPVHPTRQILASPPVFEFGSVFNATYPVWYDPSYWYEGLIVRFDWQSQAHAAGVGLHNYLQMLSDYGVGVMLACCLLLAVRDQRLRLIRGIIRHWWLWLTSLAVMAVYALVHVEPRYVAPFLVVGLLAVIASLAWPASRRGRGLVLIAMGLVLASTMGLDTYRAMIRTASSRLPLDVAEEAGKAGIKAGDRIASLGYSNLFNSKWARLARVRIVAEIYDKKGTRIADPQDVLKYWKGDDETKQSVTGAFRRAGAVAVVADALPSGVSPEMALAAGWRQLGRTGAYIQFLDRVSIEYTVGHCQLAIFHCPLFFPGAATGAGKQWTIDNGKWPMPCPDTQLKTEKLT